MRFSELNGRTVAVWGLGRETRSFLLQARRRLPGVRLAAAVLDEDGIDEADGLRFIRPADVVDELGAGDVLVRSPGVTIHRPEIEALAAAGVTVATATGLWLAERGGRNVIGITGTKGKSTTATLAARLGAAAGAHMHLAGNIGRPALDLLDAPADDWAVVELSSYQVADLTCGPQVAVVLNLFHEHVDWHGSEEVYRREKLRLLSLPGVETCVYPPADADIAGAAAGCARSVHFEAPGGWRVAGDDLRGPAGESVALDTLSLRGRHNAVNLCAALAALEAAGIEAPPLPDALEGTPGLPHRLETVLEAGGVEWVDDSISTTPESSLAALAAFGGRPVVLIGGGQDREQDYAELGRVAAERGAFVAGLPVTGARLVAAARRAGLAEDRAVEVADMAAAVELARGVARAGTVVLLSPAAPSYNAYANFEERGRHFAELAARR